MLGRGGARKNCANSWMADFATSTAGKRFHVLRVKNRFDPNLDKKPELLNGGYRDINIKLKIGFTEGKNGRAELMTVRIYRDYVAQSSCVIPRTIYRWISGQRTRQTIASCVRCRWDGLQCRVHCLIVTCAFFKVRLRAFHDMLSAKQDMHGNYVLMRNLMSS